MKPKNVKPVKLFKLRKTKEETLCLFTEKVLESITLPDIINELNLSDLAWEEVYLISLNKENSLQINGVIQLAIGDQDESKISLRQVVQSCLLLNASQIVLLHNHPNSNAKESEEDKVMFEQLNKDLEPFKIMVIDSVIVAKNEIRSKNLGKLK